MGYGSERLIAAIEAQKVSVVEKFFEEPETLRREAEQAFSLFDAEMNLPKLRVYHNRGLREDLKLLALKNPKRSSEAISNWAKRSLGVQEEYCFVLNGATKWSALLHDFCYDNFVHPIVSIKGRNHRPFDVYMFAGEYGITPFGVHYDWEDSILLHLGPEEKAAYYWPDYDPASEEWSIPLRVNRFDFQDFPQPPKKVVLRPGDLFYIPRHRPHVMANGGYSVTLGVIPNPSDAIDAIGAITSALLDNLKGEARDGFANEKQGFMKLADGLTKVTDAKLMFEKYCEQQARMRSNGWLVPAPIIHAELPRSGREGSYSFPARYPASFIQRGLKLKFFARGREMEFPHKTGLVELLEFLGSGGSITLGEFQHMLSSDFEPAAIEAIFHSMLSIGGLVANEGETH